MEEIYIIYGNLVEEIVFRLIEESHALDGINRNDTVFIKPNLVVSRENWAGIDTDPRVVEALIKSLKNKGISRITLGDGSGMGYSSSKAFHYCGYTEMAARYGLHLIDLEKDRFVKLPVKTDGPFRELEIARAVYESDIFINVPIMKAHGQTLITCSLKNLKGTMPRSMKTRFHSVDLDMAIAQLNSVLKPDLIIVDGLKGDLSFELGHDPVVMERILLGTNPVEIDSVVADTLGYKPRDIGHIARSADAGLGRCDLKSIKIKSLNHPSKLKKIIPPVHFAARFPCTIDVEGACCTCMGNLIFALKRLRDQRLLSNRFAFYVGQKSKIEDERSEYTIAVGTCSTKKNHAHLNIEECPPSANLIYERVSHMVKDKI